MAKPRPIKHSTTAPEEDPAALRQPLDDNVAAWVQGEVWRDVQEEFPKWEVRFDQQLRDNQEWGRQFARLKTLGCDERRVRFLLFSYTRPLHSLPARLERMRRSATALERAAKQLSRAAKSVAGLQDDFGYSSTWAWLLGLRQPLRVPEFLGELSYFYERTAETYRLLSDGRGSDQAFTGMFLVDLVDHVKRATGKKRLESLAHLVNAAFRAHGRRGHCTDGALKDQLKKDAARAAHRGIGAGLLDSFFSRKG